MPPSDAVPARDSIVDNLPDVSPAVGPRALAALHELAVAASGVLGPTALAKIAVDLACDLLGVDGGGPLLVGLQHRAASQSGRQP